MESALVSVVMPTRNRQRLLQRALQSVLNQTHENLEIVVVDDASTDRTGEMVMNFQDGRIRYVLHENQRGGSVARNTGICTATGEYITFLDDDDELEPEKIKEQLEALEQYDAVLCTSVSNYEKSAQPRAVRPVTIEELRQGKHTTGGTGILMAKTEVLKTVLFDESLPRYQDWDLFIRIGMKYRIAYLHRGLVRYNTGDHDRITNKIRDMSVSEMEKQLNMVHKHREFFGDKWYRRHMCRALIYGLKYRKNRFDHVAYVASQYGTANVIWALGRRAFVKIRAQFGSFTEKSALV